jgi:hypothetical protein
MQMPHTTDIESSLLRSPKASEGEGGALGEAEALKRGNTVGVRDQVMDLVAGQGLQVSRVADNLLPTPNTMEHREIKTPQQIAELKKRSPGGYRNLRESVVNELLPTPIVRDYKDGQAAQTRDGVVSVDTVARAIFNSGEVTDISWGKFAPAIERWEAATRPAPAPTKPDGKNGNHRLSADFTEWMMGLPKGWVCSPEIGLKRNDQLKACGNGVVPQQAELALNMLLDDEIIARIKA